jgi:hypothetical protein
VRFFESARFKRCPTSPKNLREQELLATGLKQLEKEDFWV